MRMIGTSLCTMAALLALLLQPATASEENSTRIPGCFDFRRLSCNVSLSQGDDKMDVNTACLAMERAIQKYWGRAVELARSNEDVERHQIALSDLTIDDDLCYGAHQAYHKCWWCAPTHLEKVSNDFCKFKSCEQPDVITTNVTATCEEMQETYDLWDGAGYPATVEFCLRAEQSSFACPIYCNLPYLGADTDRKKRTLVWMSRASAFLSVFGAAFIIFDVVSNPKNRKTVYHQLLLAMAIFDVVTGLAWALSTLPVPKEKFWIHGAVGNMATCKTQAFFVQLGFTSIFYNVSLALYYLLVIVYAWREHGLLKIRPYLHGFPLTVGIILAFGGIPLYDWFEYGCHLLPPPDGKRWPIYVFAVGPLGFSILAIMGFMGTVYYKVRAQAQSSKKWSGGGKASALQAQVFYQSLFYVLSFLISWPILFAMYLASVDVGGPYGLTMTIAFAAPLQGFSNFLVYIRPKLENWQKQRQKKLKGKTSTGATVTLGRPSSTASNASGRYNFFHSMVHNPLRGKVGSSSQANPSQNASSVVSSASTVIGRDSLAGDHSTVVTDILSTRDGTDASTIVTDAETLHKNEDNNLEFSPDKTTTGGLLIPTSVQFHENAAGHDGKINTEESASDNAKYKPILTESGENENKVEMAADDEDDDDEGIDPSVLIAQEGYMERELEKERQKHLAAQPNLNLVQEIIVEESSADLEHEDRII